MKTQSADLKFVIYSSRYHFSPGLAATFSGLGYFPALTSSARLSSTNGSSMDVRRSGQFVNCFHTAAIRGAP